MKIGAVITIPANWDLEETKKQSIGKPFKDKPFVGKEIGKIIEVKRIFNDSEDKKYAIVVIELNGFEDLKLDKKCGCSMGGHCKGSNEL